MKNSIDIWIVCCVICEMVLEHPLFQGESSVDQIVEIIKVCGTPSKNDYLSYQNGILKMLIIWYICFLNVPNGILIMLTILFIYFLGSSLISLPDKSIKMGY